MELHHVLTIQLENHYLISALYSQGLLFVTWRSDEPPITDIEKAYRIEGDQLVELHQDVADISPIVLGKHYLVANPAPYRLHAYIREDDRLQETTAIPIDMYNHVNKVAVGDDYLLCDTQGYSNRELTLYRLYGSEWVNEYVLNRQDFGLLDTWDADDHWLVMDVPDVYEKSQLLFYRVQDDTLNHYQTIQYFTTIDSQVILAEDVCVLCHESLEIYHYQDQQWQIKQLIDLPEIDPDLRLALTAHILLVASPSWGTIVMYQRLDNQWQQQKIIKDLSGLGLVLVEQDTVLIGLEDQLQIYRMSD